MQLYNTLSAEERAIMIDDAGKQRLTLSFYAYAQIQNPTQFRNELFLAWNPLEVLGRIYVANEGINAQLSLPADNFYAFKDAIEAYDFMKGIRLNIAVEQDDHSFLKLTIKVRDKIVADGLEDKTFDVTNIGIHSGFWVEFMWLMKELTPSYRFPLIIFMPSKTLLKPTVL